MKNKRFDGKFLDFPLYCLTYCNGEAERLKDIALFCVVDYALKTDFEQLIQDRIKDIDFSLKMTDGIVSDDLINQKIFLATQDYGVKIDSFDEAKSIWIEIKTKIINYEDKFGKDAFCRMPKQLTYEVIEGKFPFREFSILAAIYSKLGKKNTYYKMSYEQIAYRMLGYRRKDIALIEKPTIQVLPDWTIGYWVKKLKKRRFFRSATFFKEKYYSTRIKYDDTLRVQVGKMILRRTENNVNIEEREWQKDLQKEIKRIRLTKTRNRMYLDTDPNV